MPDLCKLGASDLGQGRLVKDGEQEQEKKKKQMKNCLLFPSHYSDLTGLKPYFIFDRPFFFFFTCQNV